MYKWTVVSLILAAICGFIALSLPLLYILTLVFAVIAIITFLMGTFGHYRRT